MGDFGAFDRLLVVELGGSAAGAYCGRLFAGYGAEVVLIGDGPAGPGQSFYEVGKHAAPLAGRDVETLLAEADVVIQSSGTDRLAAPVEPAHPAQIVTRISPFALDGPYSEWRSSDLVDAAIAGHLRLSGDPTREPIQGVPDIVHHAAGATAFIGSVAALITRVRTGVGQLVETSHQEVLVALHQFTLCRYTHNGAILNRLGNRYAGAGNAIGGYECADGWIGLALPLQDQMERMLEVTGLISMLERDDVESLMTLMTNEAVLNSELLPYLRTQTRDELVELFQALRLPCAPTATMSEMLTDDHLASREFWSDVEVGDSTIRVPGAPFRISDHRWDTAPTRRGESSLPVGDESPADLADGPLSGMRVLDMTRVWAGPLATRILADLGAEVLMTETPWARTPLEIDPLYVEATRYFPDDDVGERPWNRSGFHNKYANNKLSTVLELDKKEGRELFAALVPTADILVENFSPRVMPGFGFDEDALHRLNPNLVYVTMPGYGRHGPNTDWVAYGPTVDSHVGHTSLTGYLDEVPWKCGIAWPDPIAGMHAAAAALVGVLDRLVEPERGGQTIEVAQIEAAINMVGQHVVAAQHEGDAPRWGNRRPGRAPQGVYPCRGDDRWIAISIIDDHSWRALCALAGWTDLVGLSLGQRWDRHDELDDLLTAFTQDRVDVDLMAELQVLGVPAGAAHDAADVMADPQLAELGLFVELDHADAGTHAWPRFAGRLSLTPATLRRPAALMGEHNEYTAVTLAGLSPERYEQLLAAGTLRTTPPA